MPSFLAPTRALLCCALFSPLAHATTATGLSSFDAIEEPLVKYFPATGKFVPDDLVNITDQGGGTFRIFERYNSEWWDGDRDTTNRDRQRAEVKGLGPHQHAGETFEYSTTWRTSPGYRGTDRFCHIFQLKGLDGDNGAPLVTLSIGTDNRVGVHYWSSDTRSSIVVREFTWKPATWQTVRIRIRPSLTADGEVSASVDGDAFQGKTGIKVFRADSTAYRPKWGLYRGARTGMAMGDDYIEHRAVSAQKVGAPEIANAALETEARRLAQTSSAAQALAWLQAQSASTGRDFAVGSIAARWAESDPPAAMAWAEAQPPGAVRLDAIERVFIRWADRDVTAAAKWLHTHTPDPQFDPLVWLFTTDTTYRYVNHPVALAALPQVADPTLRAAAFETVLLIWGRQGADDSLRILDETPALTAAQKEPIRQKLRARVPGDSKSPAP